MKRLFLAVLGLAVWAATASAANPVVVMETSMGTIKIELNPDKAPITVQNFLKYVEDKHYDGTIFHRVIPTFMIQGGGMTPEMKEKGGQYPPITESGYVTNFVQSGRAYRRSVSGGSKTVASRIGR